MSLTQLHQKKNMTEHNAPTPFQAVKKLSAAVNVHVAKDNTNLTKMNHYHFFIMAIFASMFLFNFRTSILVNNFSSQAYAFCSKQMIALVSLTGGSTACSWVVNGSQFTADRCGNWLRS